MKTDIHPDYETATVTCSCGNTFETRSTVNSLHVELCNECHPFFTGKQKLVDSGGRVERFRRRYAADETAQQQKRPSAKAAAKAASKAKAAEVATAKPKAKKAPAKPAKAPARTAAKKAAATEEAAAAEDAVVADQVATVADEVEATSPAAVAEATTPETDETKPADTDAAEG